MGRVAPIQNEAYGAAEWQTISVRLVGRQVSVTLNGVRVIDRQTIEGPTSNALDTAEGDPGPIMLLGDRGPVTFRKIIVYPLVQP